MIGCYSLFWYLFDAVVQSIILTMTFNFPQYFNYGVVTFFQSVWCYSPEIILFCGVLLGLYAELGRKEAEKRGYR